MYRILDTIYNIIYLAYCRPTETDGAWDLQWESDGSQQTQHTVLPPSIPSRLWGILGTFFNFSEPLVRIAKPIPWYLQRDIHIENAGGWTTQDSPWRKVGKCEPRQTWYSFYLFTIYWLSNAKYWEWETFASISHVRN